MACINIDPIHNCNNCKFGRMDRYIFENTTELNIVRLVCKVLWIDNCTKYPVYDGIQYSVIISCTGTITIKINNKVVKIDKIALIKLSHKFLSLWYEVNNSHVKEEYSEKILQLIKTIEDRNNINKIQNESLKVAKYIENTTLGNRVSDNTYFPRIGTVSSSFKLSDTSSLTKLKAISLVKVLADIVYHIKYLKLSTLFVDLDTCYATYIGELSISPNLILCSCTIKTMKTVYSKYLNAWCKNNFMQCKEIEKIKRSIDASNRSQDLNELHNNSVNLLNTLKH